MLSIQNLSLKGPFTLMYERNQKKGNYSLFSYCFTSIYKLAFLLGKSIVIFHRNKFQRFLKKKNVSMISLIPIKKSLK